MYSRQNRKARLFFALLDVVLIWLSLELAYALRSHLTLQRLFFLAPSTKYLLLFFSLLAFILSALWQRIYDVTLARPPIYTVLAAARQGFWAAIAVVLFDFLVRLDLSRPFLAFFFLFTFVSQSVARLLVRAVAPSIVREFAGKRQLLIVGSGDAARNLGALVENSSDYGLTLLAFLDDAPGTVQLSRLYDVQPLSELPRLLERQVVDEVLFAVSSSRLSELEDVFLLCDEEGVRTRVDVAFFPHVNSRVDLERLSDAPLLTFTAAPHDELRLIVKRATDFVLCLAALIVLAPLLLILAVLIRTTSPGPVIFRQQRCGLNGRRFTLYKFRTMVAGAEARQAELAHLNVKRTAFKIPNDPRLTPLGRWLRKFSLDELPQLWNIVKGEMAIVGPRPAVPSEVAEYERWQRRRLRMRPGLTCLWTLAGRDALAFDEWMKLDLAYIDTWSLKLDWSIMLRTIPHVLTGKGAH